MAGDLPELLGGSADLTGSNNTKWSGSVDITEDPANGNYIYYGVREFGMTAVVNGIYLHGGFIPYAGTFLVGVTFGAGWAPCIGPVLGGILTYAATREGLAEGVQLLGVYSAGLAVPFLVASLALSRFLSASRRFRRWLPWVERASGALLILVGVLLLSGQFTVLARWATQFTPDFILQNI